MLLHFYFEMMSSPIFSCKIQSVGPIALKVYERTVFDKQHDQALMHKARSKLPGSKQGALWDPALKTPGVECVLVLVPTTRNFLC